MDQRHPETLAPVLGSSFVNELVDRDKHAVLRIGKDRWSKHDIADRLKITHTVSCGILSAICARLGVHSTEHLYQTTSPYTFADKKMGVTTLYVMFAAFRDKGLSVTDWVREGYGEKKAIVTFETLKAREQKFEGRARKDERHRHRHARVNGNVHHMTHRKAV